MTLIELIMSIELGLIYGIVAVGIYITFRVIDFPDLTCDGSFVLGAASSCIAMSNGCSPWIGLLASFIAGSLAGLTTGLLNTLLQIKELLSGILVAFMLYSVNLKVMGGLPNISIPEELTIFTDSNNLNLLLLFAFITWFVIAYTLITNFGLGLFSIGQNKLFALSGGINVKLMTIIGLACGNGLIGLGGALFSQHQGFVDISQGIGTLIVGVASVQIGEKILPFRSPWIIVFGCIVASILYRILVTIALHSEFLGLQTQDLNIITGLMVIGIMLKPRRQKC